MARKKKPALKSVGHGDIRTRKVSARVVSALREKGHSYINIAGHRKRVTKGNLKKSGSGYVVQYYRRSDTKKPALRNFARDRARKASRRAIKGKGNTGD